MNAGRPAARRWRLAFYGWLALTLLLLLAPGATIAQAHAWLVAWLPFGRDLDQVSGLGLSDKAVHGLLFAGLGLLATRVWMGAALFARIMLVLLLLGAGTELAQHFIPGRGASMADFAADSLGLLLGFALARRWHLARRRRDAR